MVALLEAPLFPVGRDIDYAGEEEVEAIQVGGMAIVVGALSVVAIGGARRRPELVADEETPLAP